MCETWAASLPLKLVDAGKAKILDAKEYPEPLKRFSARERSIVHVRLPAAVRRRPQLLSQAKGVGVEELARQWVEQGLARSGIMS